MAQIQNNAVQNHTVTMMKIGTSLLSQTAEQTRKITTVEAQVRVVTSLSNSAGMESVIITNRTRLIFSIGLVWPVIWNFTCPAKMFAGYITWVLFVETVYDTKNVDNLENYIILDSNFNTVAKLLLAKLI